MNFEGEEKGQNPTKTGVGEKNKRKDLGSS